MVNVIPSGVQLTEQESKSISRVFLQNDVLRNLLGNTRQPTLSYIKSFLQGGNTHISLLRNKSPDVVQAIEERIGRPLKYQDIAGIQLFGKDVLNYIQAFGLRDAKNSGVYSSLAQVYVRKFLKNIENTKNAISSKAVSEYKNIVYGYDADTSLQEVIEDYYNWINSDDMKITKAGAKQELLKNTAIVIDDLKTISSPAQQKDLLNDVIAISTKMQLHESEKTIDGWEDTLSSLGQTPYFFDIYADHFRMFLEKKSDLEQKEYFAKDINIQCALFLEYLGSAIKTNTDRQRASALIDMFNNHNDVSKCSMLTQKWFYETHKNLYKQTKGYEDFKDMISHISPALKPELFENIVDTIYKRGRTSIPVNIYGKEGNVEIDVQEFSHTWEGDSMQNAWNRPLPLSIELSCDAIGETQTFNLAEGVSIQDVVGKITQFMVVSSVTDEEATDALKEYFAKPAPNQKTSSKMSGLLSAGRPESNSTLHDALKSGKPTDGEVMKNLLLKTLEERYAAAEKLLNISALTEGQKQAIEKAHFVGMYKNKEDAPEEIRDTLVWVEGSGCWHEVGTDGKYCRGYYYTEKQIAQKKIFLKEGGFDRLQIAKLMAWGITGYASFDDMIDDKKNETLALQKELDELDITIREAKRNGIPGAPAINVKALLDTVRDTETKIEQLKEDRKKYVELKAPAGTSATDKAYYDTEIKKIEDEINIQKKKITDAQEELQPVTDHLNDLQRQKKTLKEKLTQTNRSLKELEDYKDTLDTMPEENFDDSNMLDTTKKNIDKQIRDIQKEMDDKELKLEMSSGLTPAEKKALEAEISQLREQQSALKKKKGAVDKKLENLEAEGKANSKNKFGYKDLKEIWQQIDGEKSEEPAPGKSIYVKEGGYDFFSKDITASLGNWIELRIQKVDKDTGEVVFSLHGVFTNLVDAEGKSIEGETSALDVGDFRKQILGSGFDEVLKFSTKPTVKDWGLYMKDMPMQLKDGPYKQRLENTKETIDFASMHKIKLEHTKEGGSKDANEPIKYFGTEIEQRVEEENQKTGEITKDYKTMRLWYRLKSSTGNKIILEQKLPDGTTKEEVFTPEGFMFFSAENKLTPYTQSEVDVINEKKGISAGEDTIQDGIEDYSQLLPTEGMLKRGTGLFGLKWTPAGAILAGIKKIKGGFEEWMKKRTEKDKTNLWNTWATSKGLEWMANAKIPIISEVIDDLIAGTAQKLDQEKLAKIEEHKGEPKKFGSTSGGGPVNFVKAVLFKGSEKDIQKQPLRTAGYFLAMCETGEQYPRGLQEYDGSGSWVKMILGPQYQKEYLLRRADLLKQMKANPRDEKMQYELGDMYAKQDLGFFRYRYNSPKVPDEIKAEFTKIYGEAFFTKLMGQAEGSLGTREAIDKENQSENIPFYQLKKDFYDSADSSRPTTAMKQLEKLTGMVRGDEKNYYDWAGAMLFTVLSGLSREQLDHTGKEKYEELARKFAFVPGLYVRDCNAPEQLVKLIDVVSASLGKEPLSKNGFDAGNYSAAKNNRKIFNIWVHDNHDVIDALMSPQKLLDILGKENPNPGSPEREVIPGQESLNNYNVVKDYLDTKFLDTETGFAGQDTVKGALMLEKHIWAFSPALVKNALMGTKNLSSFNGKNADYAPKLWRKLGDAVKDINKGKMTKEKYEFVLRRFVQYFGDQFNNVTQKLFVVGIRENNKTIISQAIRGSWDAKGTTAGENLHPEVNYALEQFENMFAEGKELYGENSGWISVLEKEDDRLAGVRKFYNNVTREDAQALITARNKRINLQQDEEGYYGGLYA